ncbi:MAG: type II toxin-antitoxin system VapC family toxin [Magnetococcales bacterium]|nr:type II toxin-antitoxin system VapC family toxin [Magnetococcales bacterium]
MKPRLYLETSIVSYLAAMPSRDLVVAAHQQITHEWWAERHRYELFVSELVIQEIAMGDRSAAQRRLSLVDSIPVLAVDADAVALSRQLQEYAMLPAKANVDSLHISLAALQQVEYLLTWNCRHIANSRTRRAIDNILKIRDMPSPAIVTPEELLEDEQP